MPHSEPNQQKKISPPKFTYSGRICRSAQFFINRLLLSPPKAKSLQVQQEIGGVRYPLPYPCYDCLDLFINKIIIFKRPFHTQSQPHTPDPWPQLNSDTKFFFLMDLVLQKLEYIQTNPFEIHYLYRWNNY